jgi:DNA polymerase
MRQIGLFESAGDTTACKPNTAVAAPNTAKQTAHTEKQVFNAANTGLQTIQFYPDFNSWWQLAINCLNNNTHPADIWWTADSSAPRIARKRSAANHTAFIQEATAASCHRHEDRWALLYSILWRLNHTEPQLLELSGDPEVAKLRKYAKAVARDVHKMKAFVRFRLVDQAESGEHAESGEQVESAGDAEPTDQSNSQPRYVSWFEPQHYIVEYAAPFFKRRFSNMHWSILTPVGCAHWECGGELWFSDAVDKNVAPDGDQFEDAWRVYYKSIFNPARLKISAMQSEMPKKYWKNLPEAHEIATLVASAEQRTRVMVDQRKSEDTFHCGARPAHPDQTIHQQLQQTAASSLQATKLQASLCSGCPQGMAATQTVFGEGPDDAKLMIIGEQPGDEEDLQGKPFVGPAGQLLNSALKHAGIEREQCYLTNAVKHFGFEPRGKRRLHKRPEASVVSACGQWLERELEIIKPDIVVYLGATAASTRFGSQVRVSRDRGKLITREGKQHLITVHPSSILRLSNRAAQQQAYVQLVSDLALCS